MKKLRRLRVIKVCDKDKHGDIKQSNMRFLTATFVLLASTMASPYSTVPTQITAFYDLLNKPMQKDISNLASEILIPNWVSYSDESTVASRDQFIQKVIGFGKIVPNLGWEIKEVIRSGDKVVVRSEATGTPVDTFFGVPPSGKSFKIMTIDTHVLEGEKLSLAYHVEDWAGAIAQLS